MITKNGSNMNEGKEIKKSPHPETKELVALAKEVGIKTVEDMIIFVQSAKEPNESLKAALERHLKEVKTPIEESLDVDDDLEKCAWCGEEFESSELENTSIGRICFRCKKAIESKEGPLNEDKSNKDNKEGVNSMIKNKTIKTLKENRMLREDKYYLSAKDAADDMTRVYHYLEVNGYAATEYSLEDATKKASLGYLTGTPEGYIKVHAKTKENLAKANEIAADFDCVIEEDSVTTRRNGEQEYTIVINPYCGYEFGSPECEAAMKKYTPANQEIYDKKKAARKAAREVAATEDEDDDIFDDVFEDDLDESKKPVCADCGRECAEGEYKEEIDLGCLCEHCAKSRRRLGESLTFIKRLNRK